MIFFIMTAIDVCKVQYWGSVQMQWKVSFEVGYPLKRCLVAGSAAQCKDVTILGPKELSCI